ncbi:LysE family translocator [Cochlodiniinecator piscidefendens]|uniref:LysE family translocator n=1 Tax=Cochlodiniinecator piscidefendens TaxID=2715756 RepID=UPI0014099F37|nr:LysE family translocator [Cochlodiniinecator piscidefendens]
MVHLTFALLLFLFPLAYSPGPGNMFFAANGARFGFRSTIPANIGYHLATLGVSTAIGLGFVATLDAFPQFFSIIKGAGSAYVLWIAWKMFRANTLDGDQAAKPATFMDGFILLLLNPKGYVIMALMFTQFLTQPEIDAWTGVLFIATIFTLNNLVAFSLWAMIGDKIATYFRTPESARKLNTMFGAILAAVAIWMFLS